MEYVYVSNLNKVDELLIKCLREWVKGIYQSYNPTPILNFLLLLVMKLEQIDDLVI